MPIARFRTVLLPHQQAAFNIFQPQLVHMFETLLSTPQPWLYVHALLPGGAENLGNPEYALPGLGDGGAAGPQASACHLSRRPHPDLMTDCPAEHMTVVRGLLPTAPSAVTAKHDPALTSPRRHCRAR